MSATLPTDTNEYYIINIYTNLKIKKTLWAPVQLKNKKEENHKVQSKEDPIYYTLDNIFRSIIFDFE